MNENELLRKKFDATGYTMISEWIRSIGTELTQETYGKVLKRDEKPGLLVLMKMSAELGCTPDEIKTMLMERGETVLARLVAPAALSREDQLFLDRLHALKGDPKKLKLVMDMLESLGG